MSKASENLAKLNKAIRAATKRRENKFWKSDEATRRVLIAKDVLLQIEIGKIKPKRGTYLTAKPLKNTLTKTVSKVGWEAERVSYDGPAREALQSAPSCTACAIGSLFASGVFVANRTKLSDFADMDGTMICSVANPYKNPHFSEEQLTLMECAFEVRYQENIEDAYYTSEEYEGENASRVFGTKFRSDKARLKGIMQNVIANAGTFVP